MNKKPDLMTTKTALVLGAGGGVGGALLRELVGAGWQLRALRRGLPQTREWRDGIEWWRGDALNRADVLAAASGCAVIVHAVNPPGYRDWERQVLPMLDNTLAAASIDGATVLLPGTVYNYGPDAGLALREDAPQHPLSRKGAIRVEMERRLQAAAEAGALRVLIVRAGDFFGAGAGNSWFSQVMVTPGRPVRRIGMPGVPGVGHQWAYLPDLAAAIGALLAQRQQLPAFARLHFDGHWDADGQQLGLAVQRVVLARCGYRPRLASFPWWAVRLGAPLLPLMRELAEIRDLWHRPLRLDGSALAVQLGKVPHTPLEQAVEATLEGLGCLAAQPSAAGGLSHPAGSGTPGRHARAARGT